MSAPPTDLPRLLAGIARAIGPADAGRAALTWLALDVSQAVVLVRNAEGTRLEVLASAGFEPALVGEWKLDAPLSALLEAVGLSVLSPERSLPVVFAARPVWGLSLRDEAGVPVGVLLASGTSANSAARLGLAAMALGAKLGVQRAAVASQSLSVDLLRHRVSELEAELAQRDALGASLSHELRAPLTAIIGTAQMLLAGVRVELSPPGREAVERIDANGRQLLALVNDLLDQARLDAQRMPVYATEFDVRELVREVVRELAPLVSEPGLSLVTRVPSDLPPLRSDRRKLKQIVLSLLGDALERSASGAVALSIVEGTESLEVRVADMGVEPRAEDSPSRGLSHSVTRQLATLLQGELSLRRNPGGNEVSLVLPVRRAADASADLDAG